MNDDDELAAEERAAILKRRAIFVASAIAGLTLPAACSDGRPTVCLEAEVVTVPTPPSASASPPTSEPPDAGAPQSDKPDADAPPAPCLEVALPPPTSTLPQVCLSKRR